MGQFLKTGQIVHRRGGASRRSFERRYTAADIRLLAEVDATLGQMAGPATREVMRREFEVYGEARSARLAHISVAHLYNLRKSTTYLRKRTVPDRARPVRVAIGERRPPRPDDRPGFVRVDTVHQSDLAGDKGGYLINVVDEVTQFEYVGAVAAISERFLVPVLETRLRRRSIVPGLPPTTRFRPPQPVSRVTCLARRAFPCPPRSPSPVRAPPPRPRRDRRSA